jgi:hypothetical protein
VDYTKSIVEVYINFVNYSMEAASAWGKLSFLGHCGAVLYQEEKILHDVGFNPLPSWVPDWRGLNMADLLASSLRNDPELRVYNADNSSKADVCISDLELRVKSFCVNNIQSVGPIFLDIKDPNLEMQWVRQASTVDDKLVMLRTLSADVRQDGGHQYLDGTQLTFL